MSELLKFNEALQKALSNVDKKEKNIEMVSLESRAMSIFYEYLAHGAPKQVIIIIIIIIILSIKCS